MLLYINNENETKKSQIIKTINLEYELLQQKIKVLLLILTEMTAYNIIEHTIHTALCIDFFENSQKTIKSYTYLL